MAAVLAGVFCAAVLAAPARADTAASSIVQLRPGVSLDAGVRAVRAAGGTVSGRLAIIHGLAAQLSASEAAALAHDARVAHVDSDHAVKAQAYDVKSLATAYDASINTGPVWTGGATGKGVGVAVIDTGISGNMPDFKGADGTSRVVASVVTNPGAATSGDAYGHGTHVAGILAGDGTQRPAGDPQAGQYVGVAPEANLISVKASDEQGNASVLDVIYGLQFVVDHRDELNIRVVNLSLESTQAQSYKTDPLDAAVESAWLHGIVVVAAAGNRGASADAANYAPGNDPYVISVGAVDDLNTKSQLDDVPALWSSVGRTQDGVAKPEVLAPGAGIVSTLAPGSAFTTMCPACTTGAYIRAGGTSMAAPVVSGVAALVIQRHPDWTPNQVKATIIGNGRPIALSDIPEVNAAAAAGAPSAKTDRWNLNLTPNALINAATGDIDYTRSSWSRSSWSTAPDPLSATFARSSWSCTCNTTSDPVDPTRSSWSRSSWSTKWSY